MIEERVLKQFEPLVHKLAGKYYSQSDHDDYVLIGRLALVTASRNFDPDRGVKMLTYLYQAVRRALWDYHRSSTRDMFGRNGRPVLPENVLVSLADAENVGGVPADPALWLGVQQAIAGLSEQQRTVIAGFLAGDTYKEIADSMGVSACRVTQVFRRATEEIRKALSGHPCD